MVLIELKNPADSPWDFSAVPQLKIDPEPGARETASYWSPVDIVENRTLDTIQTKRDDGAISFKAKPLHLHLDKNGLAAFKIDANQTKWDQQISSRWPALSFSQVVRPGDYAVSLDFGDPSDGIRCNSVDVRISRVKQKD